jgi:hypothetical protein
MNDLNASLVRRSLAPLLILALAAGGCSTRPASAPPIVGSPVSPTVPVTSPAPSANEPPPSAPPPPSVPPATELPSPEPEYSVTYNWGILSPPVTVAHKVIAPIEPPPGLPLPALVAIAVGDHADADPKFQRISFMFRGAFPEYNLAYVRELTSESTGEAIGLDGNAVLRIGFVGAQAHDNEGQSTVIEAPDTTIGLQNIRSYAASGDYEGHVTFGLGLQVAPDSDQVLAIRAGELTKPDGSGDFLYIVHVDVMNG